MRVGVRVGVIVASIAVVAALVAGCAEPVRPTLTTDAIGAPTTAVAAEALASPQPGETTTTGTATAPDAEAAADGADGADESASGDGAVEQLLVEVIESFPHDATAFTQGLELHDGTFIESTGLYGESSLRRVVPATGEVQQQIPISDEFFAEGLTRVGEQLIQLTWQENTAFYWDADTFEPIKQLPYAGEGWGLCYDGTRLIMTDGTPVLIFRDPESFAEIDRVGVTVDGQPVHNLNEIECVDGQVWANIWMTDVIVRIEPATGNVTGVVDASALAGPDDGAAEASGAVLNGIAWDAATQSFYVTGKLWPTMYRVNFVPAAG